MLHAEGDFPILRPVMNDSVAKRQVRLVSPFPKEIVLLLGDLGSKGKNASLNRRNFVAKLLPHW